MIYFDTDFLIHYFIIQDRKKHLLVRKIFEKANFDRKVLISLLNLQEITFVLSKFDLEKFEIEEKVSKLYEFNPVNYTLEEFKRAFTLCQKVGFQNINDCLHTAIAENYCKELYTFNQTDFKHIKNYTSLKINVLTA
jgi:predicted nucleic acid-binding protein